MNYFNLKKISYDDIKKSIDINCKSSYETNEENNINGNNTIINKIRQIIKEDEKFNKYSHVAILNYNSKFDDFFINKKLINAIYYRSIFQKEYDDDHLLKSFKYFDDNFAANLISFELNDYDEILLLFFNDKKYIYDLFFKEHKFDINYGNYQLHLTNQGYMLEKFNVGKGLKPILNKNILNDIKEDINSFFNNEDLYKNDPKLNSDYKSGSLIIGPPGTGKTLLIKYILRSKIDSYNIFMDAKDFYRSLYDFMKHNFDDNKKKIFIVEDIDSLSEYDRSGFLNFIDGCKTLNNIMFIATSNHPSKIDKALKERPSRFDAIYRISYPYFETRIKFLKHYFPELNNEDLINYADKTKGFTGAYFKYLYELHIRRKLSISDSIDRINYQKQICRESFESDLENDSTKTDFLESIKDQVVNNKSPRRDNETVEECVSRNIPIISDEYPDMKIEQVIALAYKTCNIPQK